MVFKEQYVGFDHQSLRILCRLCENRRQPASRARRAARLPRAERSLPPLQLRRRTRPLTHSQRPWRRRRCRSSRMQWRNQMWQQDRMQQLWPNRIRQQSQCSSRQSQRSSSSSSQHRNEPKSRRQRDSGAASRQQRRLWQQKRRPLWHTWRFRSMLLSPSRKIRVCLHRHRPRRPPSEQLRLLLVSLTDAKCLMHRWVCTRSCMPLHTAGIVH